MMDGDYTEEDLKKFKTMYAGSFSRSLESSDQIANYAYMIERYNLPEDYYATYLRDWMPLPSMISARLLQNTLILTICTGSV